jgi:hypothetical protein
MSGDQTGLTNGFDMGELPTNIGDTNGHPKYAGGGASAQTNDDLRLNQLDLCLKPRTTGLDFSRSRFLMQSALTKRFPLKMFDGVGDVTEITIDLRLIQSAI